jgi:hypothetical protein
MVFVGIYYAGMMEVVGTLAYHEVSSTIHKISTIIHFFS